MRLSLRPSYRLPLAASLVLHAVLLGGVLALSGRGTATVANGIDTRGADAPSGWIVELPSDAPKIKGAPAPSQSEESSDGGPPDYPIKIEAPPIRKDASSTAKAGPAVSPVPGASGGNPAAAAQPGGGAGSMFAAAPAAKSVVYVLDRSGSMGQGDAYRRACAAVIANLSQWPAATLFQVVPYNSKAEPLCVNASLGLLPNTADTVQKVEALLAALPPTGRTDHRFGLRRGLLLAPDVLYLVTDADDLRAEDVRAITLLNDGRTVIHTIEMHSRHAAQPTGALAELARSNQGTYRRVLLED